MLIRAGRTVVGAQVVDAEDASCATFEFTNEDHTLGNSLRYILMKEYVLH